MPAQLAIENPLLDDSKVYEPHAELARQLAELLPDFMIVALEPIEGTLESKLTISCKYTSSVKLGIHRSEASDIKYRFIDAYKTAVNSLD